MNKNRVLESFIIKNLYTFKYIEVFLRLKILLTYKIQLFTLIHITNYSTSTVTSQVFIQDIVVFRLKLSDAT